MEITIPERFRRGVCRTHYRTGFLAGADDEKLEPRERLRRPLAWLEGYCDGMEQRIAEIRQQSEHLGTVHARERAEHEQYCKVARAELDELNRKIAALALSHKAPTN